MKHIIACGSNHAKINGVPRQMVEIGGERIIDRTIRLLRENGVEDIAITATDEVFESCGVPVIKYDSSGAWVNCFYPTEEPTCYIFGDVVFSEKAIETIVNTPTKDIEFFASAPPFSKEYTRCWAEPFAFKVVNTDYFKACIDKVKYHTAMHNFYREPISWELWQVIKNTPINKIIYDNYTVINDYTCDIDEEKDIAGLRRILG